ncbi:hypothetical protein FRC07_014206, partial [Ceratobasidium sp. 392]
MPHSNPGAGEEGEQAPRRRRRELEQALRDVQEDNLRLREDNQRLTQGQGGRAPNGPQADDAEQQGNDIEEEAEARVKRKARLRAEAASAGRCAAVVHMPFMDDDYLFDHRIRTVLPRLLSDVKKASLEPDDPEAEEDGEELRDEHNPKLYWEWCRLRIPEPVKMTREIIYNLPPGVGKHWFKDWFKDQFLDGHRKIRADIVFHIAKNHNLIFGIADPRFRDKKVRPTLREVKRLRKDFRYQNLPPPNQNLSDPNTVFRHECIVKTIRYIFSGESAIADGARSSMSRHSHAVLWHMKEVPPAVIAFAIDFVLSSEGSFEKSSPESDYAHFFQGQLEIMKKLQADHPDIFWDLLDHFNKS